MQQCITSPKASLERKQRNISEVKTCVMQHSDEPKRRKICGDPEHTSYVSESAFTKPLRSPRGERSYQQIVRSQQHLMKSSVQKPRQTFSQTHEPEDREVDSTSFQASSQFHTAAKRLALLPITPNAQQRRTPKRTDRSLQRSGKSCRESHNAVKETLVNNARSPRKLLWPNAIPVSSNSMQKAPRASNNRFRQNFGPVQKPPTSYRPYRSPINEQGPSLLSLVRSELPRDSPGSVASPHPRVVPSRSTSSPGHARESREELRKRDPKRTAPQVKSNAKLEHMREMLPLHLSTNSVRRWQPQHEEMNFDKSEGLSDTNSISHGVTAAVETRTPTNVHDKAPPNLRFQAARILPSWQVWTFRIFFGTFVLSLNASLLIAYFFTDRHLYLLAILAFIKSKDLLCTLTDAVGISYFAIRRRIKPPAKVPEKWIASLICAYAETEEQIMKTFHSLAEQELKQHKQIVCIILDGKDIDILGRFTRVNQQLKRTYFTWKGSTGNLLVTSGFIGSTPTILVRKIRNAGKKDSLVLGHDIFNFPREDMPRDTFNLRCDIYTELLPSLMGVESITTFDFVFCTDADSTIHSHALRKLTHALSRRNCGIAACGVLVAELAVPKLEWTAWHLYQQFQYTFGQYVRRQAEGIWGRVTCLPGCITMIKVRPEMGKAISMYAKPVTNHNILEHQVQYLGTDRRLTYCILAQGKHLKSLFVPGALCETVVPNSLEHYLSQRRRWASNAYFNDYYYAVGGYQLAVTRLFATIDIVRQTLVFYRVINTGLFLHSLVERFYIIKIVPTLILTKAPVTWFMLVVLGREKVLRQRMHKLFLGMCINQVISPVLSVVVFANVLLNMGSQVWGTTGVSSSDPRHPATPYTAIPPQPLWSPGRLASIVRNAVRGAGSRPRDHGHAPETPSQIRRTSRTINEPILVPLTPAVRENTVASHPDSELRYRSTVFSPLRHPAQK